MCSEVSLSAQMSQMFSLRRLPLTAATRRREAALRHHLDVVGDRIRLLTRADTVAPAPATRRTVGRRRDPATDRRPRRHRDWTTAQVGGEPVTKTAVENDVDDEVDRRVHGQHRVGNLTDRLDQKKKVWKDETFRHHPL